MNKSAVIGANPTPKEVKFTVEGGFDVNPNLKPIFGFAGSTIGYELPNGNIVRLVVALEVENIKTHAFTYLTAEKQMSKIGFDSLDYSQLEFKP